MKALIIANSKNKKSHFSTRLIDICHILVKQGYNVEVTLTLKKYDVYNIILNKLDGVDLIVVAGGDGTMHEITNALGNLKKKPRIMYFPTGTVNDFAASLKIPSNFDEQLQILRKQKTMKVDTGKINGSFFNYICAFGPFTRASYITPHSAKNKFGKLAYFKRVLDDIPALSKSYYLDIDIDGEQVSGYFTYALIINSTSVAGFRHYMKTNKLLVI